MNKFKKAFNIAIKYGFCGDCKFKFDSDRCHKCYCYENSAKFLKELVDKETPKKPTFIYFMNDRVNADCPNCQNKLGRETIDMATKKNGRYSWAYQYCPCCGQKLDWSDE